MVLLLGGADGDDPAGLLHNAGRLARARIRYPVLLAGNAEARADAEALLRATGRTVLACDNVTPRRGEVVPGPARAVLVGLYERHVLGGRGPAVAPRFRRLVRAPTPDAVAPGRAWSWRASAGARCWWSTSARRPPTCTRWRPGSARRTVEGDLGVRAAAGGVLLEGQAEGLVDPVEADLLGPTVQRLTTEVGYLPKDAGSAAEDRRIAALAALIAVRRHLRAHPEAGHDLGLVVLTGGVFRQRDTAGGLGAVVSTLSSDPVLAPALDGVPTLVDADFAVPPAGLLAAHDRPPRPKPCCATTSSADRASASDVGASSARYRQGQSCMSAVERRCDGPRSATLGRRAARSRAPSVYIPEAKNLRECVAVFRTALPHDPHGPDSGGTTPQ